MMGDGFFVGVELLVLLFVDFFFGFEVGLQVLDVFLVEGYFFFCGGGE